MENTGIYSQLPGKSEETSLKSLKKFWRCKSSVLINFDYLLLRQINNHKYNNCCVFCSDLYWNLYHESTTRIMNTVTAFRICYIIQVSSIKPIYLFWNYNGIQCVVDLNQHII